MLHFGCPALPSSSRFPWRTSAPRAGAKTCEPSPWKIETTDVRALQVQRYILHSLHPRHGCLCVCDASVAVMRVICRHHFLKLLLRKCPV